MNKNPMHDTYGPYGEDKKCRDCAQIVKRRGYFKCWKRGTEGGHLSDHKLSWDACGCWQEKKLTVNM